MSGYYLYIPFNIFPNYILLHLQELLKRFHVFYSLFILFFLHLLLIPEADNIFLNYLVCS